jgi:serine/threonine-protein kinase
MTDLAAPESTRETLRFTRNFPRAGTVIGGRYLVERVLGVGGMGAVVAAQRLDGGGLVAIKFLLPSCAEEEQLLVRFDREARATERVRNAHVRRVLGSGTTDAGARYIVMEYLDGEDLRSLVQRGGPLDPRRAADLVAQACLGLADAHALGIVHRDLKPGNLFLARQAGVEIVKVVDFGVAKFDSPNVAGDPHDVSSVGVVLGSRHYMAPEQILAPRTVDPLADVWALGAILYYLLAGKTPFSADTLEEVTLNLLCEPPHPLAEARPGLSPQLVEIVARCLSKERSGRFPNVVELMRALAPFTRASAASEPPRSVRAYLLRTQDLGRPIVPAAPPLPRIAVAPAPSPARRAPTLRQRERRLHVVSALFGLLVGGAVAVAMSLAPRRAPAPAAANVIARAPEAAPAPPPPPVVEAPAPPAVEPPAPVPAPRPTALPSRKAKPAPAATATAAAVVAEAGPAAPPQAKSRLFDAEN